MALDNLTRLARAVEDNWCAAWSTLGALHATPPTFVSDTADYVCVCTPGQPELLLNIVLRYTSATPVTSAAVERVIAPFRQYHLPFQWWLTLGTQPDGLRERLRAVGLQSWGGATSMTLHLPSWRPSLHPLAPGIHLGRVASSDDASQALRVICDVFYVPAGPMALWTVQNPSFTVYRARWSDRVVAALATLRQGEVVGVYHVATLPAARRRGIAGNLLTLALHEAAASGVTLATLTATPEARALYEQLGFRTCGKIEQWVPGPELSLALSGSGRYAAYPLSDFPDC
jgi:ribosomal protein S18 acetylase RimI-like enzyme